MPLWAAGDLPCAVICQLWPGVPIAWVATSTSVVGTAQVTSDTSVDPIICAPPGRSLTTKSHKAASVGSIATPAQGAARSSGESVARIACA